MVKINWTQEARSRLKHIHDYIAQDNKTAAKKVISNIRKKVRVLKQFLQSGAIYHEIPDREIRILYYTHYRIVYAVVDPQRIDILW
jgi:toxin ParE1/3/4